MSLRSPLTLGRSAWLLLLFAAGLPVNASAHSEHDKPRFVALGGVDRGNCADRFRPCATIAYAAKRSNKGDRILVAEGAYSIGSADDLFYLTSGVVRVEGGFTRSDYFSVRDPNEHPTLIAGVPADFRDRLNQRGFSLIADGKGLAGAELALAKAQLADYAATQESQASTPCVGGMAGNFSCDDVDLLTHVALQDFSSTPSSANDIWGFVDLNTFREYAIVGLRNGTAVVDVTDPDNPAEIGTVSGLETTWRDIKVLQTFDAGSARWRTFAYVTADSSTDRLTVIDLNGLPNSIAESGRQTAETSAHNVMISNVNYATGVPLTGFEAEIFTAGSNLDNGSFRRYSLANPEQPALNSQSSGGYMHDAAAFVVTDARAANHCGGASSCELLIDFNESTFEIYRLNATTATQLSSSSYPQVGYVHSGWWSEDTQYLFVHDELDEQNSGLNTTVRVFSLSDLANPSLTATWVGPTAAIDHNGYARGNRYYMSNYTRGLTVLDITDPTAPVALASFDTFPSSDASAFNGAWGVYPFLPSGKILLSDINSGLYVLEDLSTGQGAGSISFSSATFGAAEGAGVLIEVERSGGSSPVSVAYRIQAGSAEAADYSAADGILSWGDNDTSSKTIQVQLTADGATEATEQFFVELFDPRDGATLGVPSLASVFVADQAGSAVAEFWNNSLNVSEQNQQVVVTVRRNDSVAGAMEVGYQTVDGSAAAGSDYQAVSGSLSWSDGDGSPRTIRIPLSDDDDSEGAEEFTVELSILQGNAVVGANGSVTVNINDNDASAPPPPAPSPPPPSGGGGGGGGGVTLWLALLGLVGLLARRRAVRIQVR